MITTRSPRSKARSLARPQSRRCDRSALRLLLASLALSATLGACSSAGAPATPQAAPTRAATEDSALGLTLAPPTPTGVSGAASILPETLPEVDLDPANFVAVIDNPYLPRIPGNTFVYEGQSQDGLERVELEVLSETKVILGIATTIVRDTVYVDGVVIEDTYDWLAQDKAGNVWYFGEDVSDYQDGKLSSKAGSWEAGVDGARPGVLMFADPSAHVGETYLQEYYAGEAEDTARILKDDVTLEIPLGTFDRVVQTYDFTPLDPASQEHKYFAAGLGLIKTIDLTTGDESVLVEHRPAGGAVLDLPVAPDHDRVDLGIPVFSNPTRVTNPLFPYSLTEQILLLGQVDGQPLHVSYTLLPETRPIEWNGQSVSTIAVQYSASLNGRVVEVARDWYAQADDGSDWYFGEDVYNYVDGVVVDTHGTWLAGRDGPLAMIMPAEPAVGDVYRVENIPGLVFEEITVRATQVTVFGPNGPIPGAVVGEQLHMDGSISNKTFAPGYGEFATITGTELEAVALAVPIDGRPGGVPTELEAIATGAATLFAAAQIEAWGDAGAALEAMLSAWDAHQADAIPPLLEAQMSRALTELTGAVNARQPAEARQAALDVTRAGLDLQLQYRPVAEVDLNRAGAWAQQVRVDAEAGELGWVLSDIVTLELIQERAAHVLEAAAAARFNDLLIELRSAAEAGALETVTDVATRLLESLGGPEPGS